ncbi:MAG: hypothetical protein P1U34_08035 [Coxiellaceae bacterium]|nr:hypothetical protein [Coxiellaceae bacterium]
MKDEIYDKGLKMLQKLHGGHVGEQMVDMAKAPNALRLLKEVVS